MPHKVHLLEHGALVCLREVGWSVFSVSMVMFLRKIFEYPLGMRAEKRVEVAERKSKLLVQIL